MPKVGIGDTPVQVAQAVTDGAVLQNVGNSTVYAEGDSSVSSAAYGYALAPRATLSWDKGRALWLVCASGDSSEVTVMYGGTTSALSEVSAVITGDVTATIEGPVDAEITGPVTVEGTVNVGNVVQTETTVTNNVSTTVSNTVTTEVSGTVDTVVTAPVAISGTVDVAGDVGITGPVTVSGAVNISGGTVEADITGPVTIGGAVTVGGIETPVNVQGGGEELIYRNGSVAASGFDQFTIPAPPSGQTYYGLAFRFQHTGGTDNSAPLEVEILNFGTTIEPVQQSVMSSSSLGALELGVFGTRSVCRTIIPVGASFPLTVIVNNGSNTSSRNYNFTATGISHADPIARDMRWQQSNSSEAVSFASAAANSFCIIASSQEDRLFQLNAVSGTTQGSFVVEELDSATGSWVVTQQRAQNSLFGGNTGNIAMQSETASSIRIPGTGNAHRVRNTNSVTGTIYLSYLGKA